MDLRLFSDKGCNLGFEKIPLLSKHARASAKDCLKSEENIFLGESDFHEVEMLSTSKDESQE